jgi:RimJ/RimL family protein N-acetyltransferase
VTERLTLSPDEERAILRKADGKSGVFIVAFVRGEIFGSADASRGKPSKDRYVTNLGIAPRKEVGGIGPGIATMQTLITCALSAGIRKLTLGVFAANRAALALYRRLGVIQAGRLKGQVVPRGKPVDEALMALWI